MIQDGTTMYEYCMCVNREYLVWYDRYMNTSKMDINSVSMYSWSSLTRLETQWYTSDCTINTNNEPCVRCIHMYVWDIWHSLQWHETHCYRIAGNFRGRKLREFRSFVAVHKSFLHKIWGHGIFWWHQWAIGEIFSLQKSHVFFTNSQIAKVENLLYWFASIPHGDVVHLTVRVWKLFLCQKFFTETISQIVENSQS